MGRKANPVLIGAFVVGAVALLVAGVVVFGSGRLFADTTPFVRARCCSSPVVSAR